MTTTKLCIDHKEVTDEEMRKVLLRLDFFQSRKGKNIKYFIESKEYENAPFSKIIEAYLDQFKGEAK